MIEKLIILLEHPLLDVSRYDECAGAQELSVQILYFSDFNDEQGIGNMYNSEEAIAFCNLCRALQDFFLVLDKGSFSVGDHGSKDLKKVNFRDSNLLYFTLDDLYGLDDTKGNKDYPSARINAVVSVPATYDPPSVLSTIKHIHDMYQLLNGNLLSTLANSVPSITLIGMCTENNDNFFWLETLVNLYSKERKLCERLASFETCDYSVNIEGEERKTFQVELTKVKTQVTEKFSIFAEIKIRMKTFFNLCINQINQSTIPGRGHALTEILVGPAGLRDLRLARCDFITTTQTYSDGEFYESRDDFFYEQYLNCLFDGKFEIDIKGAAFFRNGLVVSSKITDESNLKYKVFQSLFDYMTLMSASKSNLKQYPTTSQNYPKTEVNNFLRKIKGLIRQEYDVNKSSVNNISSVFCPSYRMIPPILKHDFHDDENDDLPWCPMITVSPNTTFRGLLYELNPDLSCLIIFKTTNTNQSMKFFREISDEINSWILEPMTNLLESDGKRSSATNTQHMIIMENETTRIVSENIFLEEFLSGGISNNDMFVIDEIREELLKMNDNYSALSKSEVCCPLQDGNGWIVGQKCNEIESYFVIKSDSSVASFESMSCSEINGAIKRSKDKLRGKFYI